ncbi:hypothetical protein QO021_30075 (plasmid) [Pseudomonas amygdali pv. lachrymans]|uniref:hypothetical protein n=1 Tax=Pseudomonas amygdali TaxID=47877 RepID=UPI0006B9AFC4|nr:hypothetical protein [Pseudomonas amygdali]KPC02065.1 Uncharacterized protein AC501_3351 [Pseudomonas amygdali pv. lachrymans]RMM39504.1 hypothetical protein ALQ79_200067 [Pseudomonas amygdali pv. lachrymans]WIO61336.1 hypothetical protein QO021_30075 [Pseudomonas amygdali pv. lachrymans]
MKNKYLNSALALSISAVMSMNVLAAPGETVSDGSDSPWTRRMNDVTGLFGESVKGSAVNDANKGGSYSFDTFTPFQDQRTGVVNGYGATEVGVGCNGLNLSTVMDGQIGQYQEMVEKFIQNAPALAIMYLAYSQPTIKSVIDQLNSVGQFGLDLSNTTCSGVRTLADKAYDEKKQTLAEADCTVDEGYKSSRCMAGEGLTGSLITQMGEFKQKTSDRANAMMGKVSGATGGLVGWNSSVSGGTNKGAGTGSGIGTGGTGTATASVSGKSCSNDAQDGSAGLVLAASELGCDDIKKYGGLIPSYGFNKDAASVTPRTENIENLSKVLTTEYMNLYKAIYSADAASFTNTQAYKDLVSRADIVVSENEHQYMRNLARSSPAMFISTERQLSTLGMMKELDDVISKIEIGVSSGIANQPDNVILSDEVISRTKTSVAGLRQQYIALQARIQHDQARNKVFASVQQGTN